MADDGSTDHSSELIAQYSTRLICNNHQGFRPLVIGAFKRAEVSFSSFSPRITNCSFEFREFMQCDDKEVVAQYRLHASNSSRNFEKMLIHTLKVLELQTPYFELKLEYKVAYPRGRWSWRRKYGRKLRMEVLRRARFLVCDLVGDQDLGANAARERTCWLRAGPAG